MQIRYINLYSTKKKVTTSVILVLIMAISTLLSVFTKLHYVNLVSAFSEKERVIIIDAGHGGEDSGAIGVDGILEKDINLKIATLIGEYLCDSGYTVIYTRTDDRLLYKPEEDIKGIRKISDLKNRVKVVAEYPDSIFISIHMNSYGDSRYSGLQVYYSPNDEESRRLANIIQNEVKTTLQNDNERKIKSGEKIYVLEKLSTCAVLIECGFLSNIDECKKLSEKEYQKRLSFSIVCGIIKYMEEKTML